MLSVLHDNHVCNIHRWRPYRVECPGSLPTSEVKRRRARLVLDWGTAREDLRVPPAYFHLPPSLSPFFFCAFLRVWWLLGADDSYISCCIVVCCCFGCFCVCGQSLHVSLFRCVCFVDCRVYPNHHICANLHNTTHSKHSCGTSRPTCKEI